MPTARKPVKPKRKAKASPKPPVDDAKSKQRYEAHKARQSERQRGDSKAGTNIAPIPEVKNPRRRAKSKRSLLFGLKAYYPKRFPLEFAECHLTAIKEMENAARTGEPLTCAMPRGSGKTAIAECAILDSILHGFQRFAVLLQATSPLGKKSLAKITKELETNPRLLEDFPEAVYPFRRLERRHQRAKGQHIDGEPTFIELTKESITFPTVKGSPSSGATIVVAGIEAASRGLSILGPDGEYIRPGIVLADDVQTRETAKSPTQTTDREMILTDDIMGMVGPGETMAVINLCTPIYPNDLAERFLSAELHPEFRRVRTRMIEAWPERMDLWTRYGELRKELRRAGLNRAQVQAKANEFYAEHREEMDKGARVSWPSRMVKGDLSGLQSSMNMWLDKPRSFMAEMQCEPQELAVSDEIKSIDPQKVIERLSGVPRLCVPNEASRLSAFIDCGSQILFYAVCSWNESFGGSAIDYGTWPRQNRAEFSKDNPQPSLSDIYPGLSEEERLYRGLKDLTTQILPRAYSRGEGRGEMLIGRCLIDSGFLTDVVYLLARQSLFANIIYPSKGVGRTKERSGVSEWKRRDGEQVGHHWKLTLGPKGRSIQFDSDIWKSFLYERMTSPEGGRACFSFFGLPKEPNPHAMIGRHCNAEYAQPQKLRGVEFDSWSHRPNKPDNDWWDCLVGCAVAASVQGLEFSPAPASGDPSGAGPAPRPKIKLSEELNRKRQLAGRQ